MSLIELSPLLIGVVFAQIAPGPNMMAVSSIALASGRKAGILAACGISIGVFITAIFFAFGMSLILERFPQSLLVMKFVGGGYLLFLGLRALVIIFTRKTETSSRVSERQSPHRTFMTGLGVVLTNPKAMMMWVAISAYLTSLKSTHGQFLAVGLTVALSALAIYAIYAVLFSTGVAIRTYKRFFRLIETGFGVAFGTLGAKLIVDGIKGLRN
jgi:threonine efflux protein